MIKFFGIGRMTREPEVRYTAGENAMAICSFGIVTDRYAKGQRVSDFFDAKAFGKNAEFVSKYFKKGNRICVYGDLQTDSYTNKDGVKVTKMQLVVEKAEFCDSKDTQEASTSSAQNVFDALEREAESTGKKQAAPAKDGFVDIPDFLNNADLPFNI